MNTVKLNINAKTPIPLQIGMNRGGSTGTRDYNVLYNHPFMNNKEIVGHMESADLHLQDKLDVLTEQDIDEIIFGGN